MGSFRWGRTHQTKPLKKRLHHNCQSGGKKASAVKSPAGELLPCPGGTHGQGEKSSREGHSSWRYVGDLKRGEGLRGFCGGGGKKNPAGREPCPDDKGKTVKRRKGV